MNAQENYQALMGQPQVREFLTAAVETGKVSHAYLFVGPPGSGKTETAFEFAAAILCEEGGCGVCDTCVRVRHRTHPDVRLVQPGGVSGYVIDQIREINHDAFLAPIRAKRKIYIMNRVDLLSGAAANAFLKTLEEPPEDVVFILLGRVHENIMETILSRCQVVVFHQIPHEQAMNYLKHSTGVDESSAKIALAAGEGSLTKARSFIISPSLKELRNKTLEVLSRIAVADDLDVLQSARTLLDVAKAPLKDVQTQQERELAEGKDYFDKKVLKLLEQRQKRELSAREREALLDVFAITRSWLRDCLVLCVGTIELVGNVDAMPQLEASAQRMNTASAASAIEATITAGVRISYNVTPQLVLEAMLFEIRKAYK